MAQRDEDLKYPHITQRTKYTAQQLAFLDYVQIGMDWVPAARKAGFKAPKKFTRWIRANPDFKAEIDRRLAENREAMKITRDTVQEMVMEAYEVGKLTSDPSAMVRACAELNKMSGFYELEQQKIKASQGQQALLSRLSQLSDAELLQMSTAAKAIDVEAEQDADNEHLSGYLPDYTDAEYDEEDDV